MTRGWRNSQRHIPARLKLIICKPSWIGSIQLTCDKFENGFICTSLENCYINISLQVLVTTVSATQVVFTLRSECHIYIWDGRLRFKFIVWFGRVRIWLAMKQYVSNYGLVFHCFRVFFSGILREIFITLFCK